MSMTPNSIPFAPVTQQQTNNGEAAPHQQHTTTGTSNTSLIRQVLVLGDPDVGADISKPSTTNSEEPPRKRQRTQELEIELDMSADSIGACSSGTDLVKAGVSSDEMQSVPQLQQWERDDKFYLSEGDCIVRVENTLFKVHRFILSRDSSAFEYMFSVGDQGTNIQDITEGSNDQQPMVLYNETASNFRLLLTILYALPAEIAHYNAPDADVGALLTIAEMTNKYSFITTSTWAIDTLHVLYKEDTLTNQWNPILCRSSHFKRIIEVALLCGHEELCDFAVNHWIERILNRTANPLIAMAVADKHGLVKLQGVSYYVALLESGPNLELDSDTFGGPEPNDELSPDSPQPPLELTPTQKARLLSGFFALVNLWDRLRVTAPTFQRPDGCTYHAHGCLGTWQHAWHSIARSEITVRMPPADVVGRLKAMQDLLVADGDIAFALTPVCRRAAMASVRELVKKVQDDLARYFVDLTVRGKSTGESVAGQDQTVV